jgi:hypothetical protein
MGDCDRGYRELRCSYLCLNGMQGHVQRVRPLVNINQSNGKSTIKGDSHSAEREQYAGQDNLDPRIEGYAC